MKSGSQDFRIKEGSWLAALASAMLVSKRMAIVLGRTIHLFNVTREDFISNKKWLKHELCHIEQYRRYGTCRFVFMYLGETLKKGYRQNKFEVEARKFAES